MDKRKTISQSKGLFHKDFPYVIPSVYRKVIDEYLVELNLLSNQNNFEVDGIFSYGLVKSFQQFTTGYRPKEHVSKILKSICISCDLDYEQIINKSHLIDEIASKKDLKKIEDNINEDNSSNQLIVKDNHYSRILAIGIYELMNNSYKDKAKELIAKSKELGERAGISDNKLEKDITQYINNIKRIEEAMELIKVTAEEVKKRQENKGKS